MARTVTFSQNERVTAAKLEEALDEAYNSSGVAIPLPVASGGTGGTSQATARTGLGLGTISTQNASAVAITGGTWDGGSIGATTKPSSVTSTRFSNTIDDSTPAINYGSNTAAEDQTKTTLNLRTRIYGQATGAAPFTDNKAGPYKLFFIDGCSVSDGDQVVGLLVKHSLPSNTYNTGSQSGRAALQTRLDVSGQYGDSGYIPFISQQAYASASSNQGGTGGYPGLPTSPDSYFRGGMFGANINAYLNSGATNWGTLTGLEINLACDTGASVGDKVMLRMVRGDLDQVSATLQDSFIRFTKKDDAAATAKAGIEFGDYTGNNNWPFPATATLIIAKKSVTYGGAPTPVADTGIDFSAVTFTSYSLNMPGFTVDPDGDVVAKSVTLGTGGPVWLKGTGTPEGAVTAPVGSLYSRTDGGAGSTLYVKESGTGNTGWAAK